MNKEEKINVYDYKIYDTLFDELEKKDLFYKINDDLYFFIDDELFSYNLIPMPDLKLTIPFVVMEDCEWDIEYFNDDDYKGYIVKKDTNNYRLLELDDVQTLYTEVLHIDDEIEDDDMDDDEIWGYDDMLDD